MKKLSKNKAKKSIGGVGTRTAGASQVVGCITFTVGSKAGSMGTVIEVGKGNVPSPGNGQIVKSDSAGNYALMQQ